MLLILAIHFAPANAISQSFNFKHQDAYDAYDIRTDMGHVTCLYRVSEKKLQPTIFRKVFLNESLQPIDSIDYTVPGVAKLIATEANEKYTVHVFQTKTTEVDFIHFITTEKSGEVHSTFNKSAADLASLFDKPFKKTSLFTLTFADNTGSPEMLILRPRLTRGSYSIPGKTFALSIENGALLWVLSTPNLSKIISTDERLVGTSAAYSGGAYEPHYTLHFIDKATGKLRYTEPFYQGQGYRSISVFTSNGQELLVAGTEYTSKKTKNGHFYVTMFDLEGKRLFDQVDTTARLSSQRMHALGHAFDLEGNLFVIGEGWKEDYTAAIAGTAGGILAAALLGGTPYISTQVNQKITSLVIAKISTVDGSVVNFYTFPVGPWMQFSELISDGEHVLIENHNQVLMYDPEHPQKAPSNFTSLQSREGIIISPFGPAIVKPNKKLVGLEILPVSH